MRLKFIFPLLLMISLSCSLISNKSEQKITIIDFRTSSQYFSPARQMSVIEKNVRIVSLNEHRLYIVPFIHMENQRVRNDKGEITERGIRKDTSYIVYAWNKGDKLGLKYTLANFKNEKGKIVSVDSMMNVFGITTKTFEFFNIDMQAPDTVIENGPHRLEKYPLEKTHLSGVDSVYKYYDKNLAFVDFSFSEKFDKQNKSKLVRISFIHNKIPKGVFLPDMDVPRREDFYAITVGEEKNLSRLIEIFEKFKKDRLNNK